MIPAIYDRTGNSKLGELTECLKGVVIEERNGMFEAEITYSIFSPYWMHLIRGNIFTADANDTLKAQKFRIYKTSKPISGKFSVYARHISFDIARDMIEGLDIENQSCEYCLNQIFRNSQFSRHFKGYSDIVNTQNFKLGATKVIKAIAGESGSIIDTFGTGADILRNNEEFYVLNRRGHDNGVTIEYGKNLTGIDLTEDEDGMITRIRAIAKYYDDNNTEIIVHSNPKYVDSPRVFDYETPFIEEIDFSDKFEDGVIPTPQKLTALAEKYFRDNKCDIPKTNAKLTFVALSKCVGYEGIQDKLSLCDTVTIKDYRYNFETQAKVIKTYYNFLEEKYEKMEIGDPRTNLGDIITNNGSQVGPPGPAGPPGQNGADGNIGDFPDSLPTTPILTSTLYGFASIGLDWTFENKIYYSYELYASKTKDFTPNVFDLIFEGHASTFLFSAKPNETWYFRVCCVNSHGKRTDFSNQIAVTTTKVDDLSNYVSEMAIDEALIGTLSLDRGWVGQLSGNWIDAKQLSVTDSNGLRTLWIDSYGQVDLNVRSFKIANKQVYTADQADSAIGEAVNGVKVNILPNGSFNDGNTGWNKVNITIGTPSFYNSERNWCNFYTTTSAGERYGENIFDILPNKVYNFSMLLAQYSTSKTFYRIRVETKNKNSDVWTVAKEFTGNTSATRSKPEQLSYSFKSASTVEKCRIWIGKLDGEVFDIYVSDLFMGTGTIYARKSEFEILDTKISSKVSENDFGTLVEQNAHAVKIAWNNNSKYVQFENGGLAIYNGAVNESQKRAFFDERGNHFWRDGYYVGKIGTNQYADNTAIKGINFDLEYQGGYMTWAVRKTSTASTYTMMWSYANKTIGNYAAGKLHAGADIDMHNFYLRNVNFEGGGINGTLVFTQIVGMNSNGTAARWYNNSKLVFSNGILIDATWGSA